MGKKKEKKEELRVVGMEKGDIILRVRTTKYYAIPKHLQGSLSIEDWFYRHDMHSRHAGRDAHEIGYSEMVNSVSPISYEEYERGMKEKIEQRKKLKDICQWCREPKDDVKEIKITWGPDEDDEYPLSYKICPECRKKISHWEEEKNG